MDNVYVNKMNYQIFDEKFIIFQQNKNKYNDTIQSQ